MPTAFVSVLAVKRKEPLDAVVARIYAAFAAGGEGTPSVRFSLTEGQFGTVSSVDRVLKRFPDLAKFVVAAPTLPVTPPALAVVAPGLAGAHPRRALSNAPPSPAAGEQIPLETVLAIAAGVPRTFPFHGVTLHFSSPGFGKDVRIRPGATGVYLTDSWWVNGRNRGLMALSSVDEDPDATALKSGPDSVAAILAQCGKIKSTQRVKVVYADAPEAEVERASEEATALAVAIKAITSDYKARLTEIAARAKLPHDLPSAAEARENTSHDATTGPKKPVIVRAFGPLGYAVTFKSGTFVLSRSRPHDITVNVTIDVGTWSRKLTAMFLVRGPAFRGALRLPVTGDVNTGLAYPIGDAQRWQQLIDNLAALVAELDRTFVPEIEAAAAR